MNRPSLPIAIIATLTVASVSLLALPGQAAITLLNGSFENTGTLYNPALGGLFEATDWTNLSSLSIQASSALVGVEGTDPTFMTGSRFLRLVSDDPTPDNQGAITQALGTMIAGETYTFTADVFGGTDAFEADALWGATASFVNQGTLSPSVTYATQTVSSLVDGTELLPGFNFSYTATGADDGQPLFVLLVAQPSGPGEGRRGGVDNAQLSIATVPEAGSLALALPALGLLGMVIRRRRNTK